LLGVRRPIAIPGVTAGELPTYVSRDADNGEFGMRARLKSMAHSGGFLLVVGDSSVGKTRSAYEVLRAELGDWNLAHPGDASQVDALAARPPETPLVIWLDEIRNYLDGEPHLTVGPVRTLLGESTPVVLIGTIWPDDLKTYMTHPGPREP